MVGIKSELWDNIEKKIAESLENGEQDKIDYVKKEWGIEVWHANNEKYCGKLLYLYEQHRCSMHYHKLKDETFVILEGKVLLEIEDGLKTYSWLMEPGHSYHVNPNVKHRFIGVEDSIIMEVSTTHYDDDSYRDGNKLSGKVSDEEFKALKEDLIKKSKCDDCNDCCIVER